MTPGIDDLIGKDFGGGSHGDKRKDESGKKRSGKLTEDEKEFSREHGFSGSGNGSNGSSNGNGNSSKKNGNSGKNKQQKGEDEKLPKHSIYKYSNKRRDDLHEAVIYNGLPLFLTYDGISDKMKVVENIREKNRILRPPDIEEYPYEPYEFAGMNEIQKYVDVSRNVKSIDHYYKLAKEIISKYNDQDAYIIVLLAADTVWSYFQDKFSTTHYNGIVGENGSGKSSIGDTFESIGYRVVNMTDPSAANIFRVLGNIESGQCSLVIDEADKIDKSPDMMNVLKAGYTYGKKVPKINMNIEKQNFYLPYCLKLILAERLPSQYTAKGVLDRMFTFTVYMGDNQHDIKEVQNPQGDPIREKLLEELKSWRKEMLIYRLLHYKDSIKDIDIGVTGRNKELVKPTIQLFHGTAAEEEISQSLQKHLDAKNRKKANTIEASLHPLITNLVNEQGNRISSTDIGNKIITGGIEGAYDERTPNRYESAEFGTLYRNTFTGIIHDKFGAERKHTEKGVIFTFDPVKLAKVGRSYDLITKIQTRFDFGSNFDSASNSDSNYNNSNASEDRMTTKENPPDDPDGSDGSTGQANIFDTNENVNNENNTQQNKENSNSTTENYEIITTPNNTKEVTYSLEPSGSSASSAEPSEPSASEEVSAKTINGSDKTDNDIDGELKEIMKCFYCDQSYESDLERVKHIADEHPGRLNYPNPGDFENRNIR